MSQTPPAQKQRRASGTLSPAPSFSSANRPRPKRRWVRTKANPKGRRPLTIVSLGLSDRRERPGVKKPSPTPTTPEGLHNFQHANTQQDGEARRASLLVKRAQSARPRLPSKYSTRDGLIFRAKVAQPPQLQLHKSNAAQEALCLRRRASARHTRQGKREGVSEPTQAKKAGGL